MINTEAKIFTAAEAEAIARVFVRLTEQIAVAFREGREADALAMCRLEGCLRVRIFQVNDDGWFTPHVTVLDQINEAVAA